MSIQEAIRKSAHILIVEDSPINQKILARLLKQEGHEVSIAANGIEALEKLRGMGSKQPDLIISDILMPGMDGFTLCSHLKKEGVLQDIPVIFISSLDETGDKVKGFEVGGVDYITKPFHAREVIARIQTHLKLRFLQRQIESHNVQLHQEKQRSEALLLNVLPARVAEGLMADGYFPPQLYTDVTVSFIDIVGFTAASSQLAPDVLVDELNALFSGFDTITRRYSCERIKTVGDGYLFTCGLPEAHPRHAHNIADAVLAILDFIRKRNEKSEHIWQIRSGIHTGEVIGGIVGIKKYVYDIFGDTVNIAARLESLAEPMHIQVSEQVFALLRDDFLFSSSYKNEIKGKGIYSTYCLQGRKK